MFTGIVQALCPVLAIERTTNLQRIRVRMQDLTDGLQDGASVAINGVCLTVTAIDGDVVAFDVIQETLDHTNLGNLAEGALVNVERSLRFGDEVGGHILSGHISARVSVAGIDAADNARVMRFAVPEPWLKYLHHKGFVALDGASLTIASVDPAAGEISVALIPETTARTTLGVLEAGDWVNLEVDKQTQAVVDTVARLMESGQWPAPQ